MSSFDLVGPFRGECGICGGPDARHRTYDAIAERVLAGEPPGRVADDYGLSVENVIRIAGRPPIYWSADEESA